MQVNSSDEILEAALALPTRERVRLARHLLASIEDEGPPDEGWEEAWRVEIERRLAEIRDGSVELLDASRVLTELRAELASRKPVPVRAPSTAKARRRSK